MNSTIACDREARYQIGQVGVDSTGSVPDLWDGKAAARIVDVIRDEFQIPKPK